MKKLLVLAALFQSSFALAQAWSVPKPNAAGDFNTGFMMGNRGYLAQTMWVVTDSDENGLNCRKPGGQIVSRFLPGELIEARYLCDASADAIQVSSELGGLWLLVDASGSSAYGRDSGLCMVRANIKYIAPVNEDSVQPKNGSITVGSLNMPAPHSGCN